MLCLSSSWKLVQEVQNRLTISERTAANFSDNKWMDQDGRLIEQLA